MKKIIKVLCKRDCSTVGNAFFYKNETYYCEILGNSTYYILDKNGLILRMDDHSLFSYHFYTEKELRKLKIEKLKNE